MSARRLRPCGTEAAYSRHRYRGEPVDDACEQAHLAYQRDWAAAARARSIDRPPCTGCGGSRKKRQGARGWCQACYCRWIKAGRPAGGPPPREKRRRSVWTERRADYRWLRDGGEPIDAAAKRVGITEKTARRWETAA